MMNLMKKTIITFLICITSILAVTTHTEAAKLNKKEVILYVGQSVNLKMEKARGKVTWKSCNKKIATVSNTGEVYAKKKGDTTVVATFNCEKYRCHVIVRNREINRNTVTLRIGECEKLKLLGAKAKKWSTSNKSIVKVNKNGVVKAYSLGNADVVVKAKNGKKYYCKVNVIDEDEYQESDCSWGHSFEKQSCDVSSDGKTGIAVSKCSQCGKIRTYYGVTYKDSNPWLYAGESYQLVVEMPDMKDKNIRFKLYEPEFAEFATVSTSGLVSCTKNPPYEQVCVMIEMYMDETDNYVVEIDDLESYADWGSEPYLTFTNIGFRGGRAGEARTYEKKVVGQIIKPEMSKADKVRTLHDWICRNLTYDDDACKGNYWDKNWESYDSTCILNGKAVCSGYANVFRDMAKLAGLNANYIRSNKLNHAYNQVELDDGQWYWLDLTWDDCDDEIRYDFYLLSGKRAEDEKLKYDEEDEYHECMNDGFYRYKTFEKYYCKDQSAVKNSFLGQKGKGNMYFLVEGKENDWADYICGLWITHYQCRMYYSSSEVVYKNRKYVLITLFNG